jgi:membrane protein
MAFWNLLVRSGNKFIADDCPTQAAAMAFYTLFSLPPLLAIIVWIAGLVLKPEDVRGSLERQLTEITGEVGKEQIRGLLANAQEAKPGIGGQLAGLFILLFGASGVIGQLQFALNRIWSRPNEPPKGIFFSVVLQRLIAAALVIGVGLLMLAFLFLNALLSTIGKRLAEVTQHHALDTLLWLCHSALSVLIITLIFAGMFRYLTSFRISRWEAIVGGVVSAILFTVGNAVLGRYLSMQNIGSAYGSAGSLAVMLVWVYYSAMIFLFGAELTQQTGLERIRKSKPKEPA